GNWVIEMQNISNASNTRKKVPGNEENGRATLDLETRAQKGDHQALRLWLRLLTCTVRIENQIRIGLRREFGTTLPRFDLMAQLERSGGGLRMNELAPAAHGIRRQRYRYYRPARARRPGDAHSLSRRPARLHRQAH